MFEGVGLLFELTWYFEYWKISAHWFCWVYRIRGVIAVIGQHRHSQPDNFTVRVPVSRVIPNKKYGNPSSPWAKRGSSDIMLLKLAHPVEFNDAVSPVCLPSLFQVLPAGKPCYSSGWGQLSSRLSCIDHCNSFVKISVVLLGKISLVVHHVTNRNSISNI